MSFDKRLIVASAALASALVVAPLDVRADSGARFTRAAKQREAKVIKKAASAHSAPSTASATRVESPTHSISLLSNTSSDQVTIPTSSATPKFKIEKLESPPRLVIDIESERISGAGMSGARASDRISGIRVGKYSDKSRVVLDLHDSQQLTHSAEVRNGRIVVSLTSAMKAGVADSQALREPMPRTVIAEALRPEVTRVGAQTRSVVPPKAGGLRLDEEVVKSGGSASLSIVDPKLPADEATRNSINSARAGSPSIDSSAQVVEVVASARKSQQSDSKASKTLVTNVSLNHTSSANPTVVVALNGDAEYGMIRTAPSEYVLTVKNAQTTKDLRKKTLFSSERSGSIRSVRTIAAGNDTQIRIFIQPSSYLTTRKLGDKVLIEESQDLTVIARDVRAQLDPRAAQTPAAAPTVVTSSAPTAVAAASPDKTPAPGSSGQQSQEAKAAPTVTPNAEKVPSTPSKAPEVSKQADVAKKPDSKEEVANGKSAAAKDPAKPLAKKGEEELAGINGGSDSYTGRLISLDLQDADIDSALRIIAEVSNLNIVAGDGVTGKVTLKLVDVPWDQALDVILKSHGLDKVVEGNVMRVASVDKLQAERESLKKARVAGEELEDLNVKYMRVSYAKASEIKALVETVLSERGSVAFDERSNQLIVKDIGKGLKNVSELVKKIDLRTPQILLETQIVEASRNLTRDLGSELGFQYIQSPATGNGTGLNFPAAIAVGGSNDPGTAGSITGSAFPAAGISNTLGSAITMLFDSADGTKSLSTRLTQLEQEGRVRIISRPAVATTNNKPAEIKSVEKYRVKLPSGGLAIATGGGANANGAGNVATQTIEAGITLNVTPQASPDYYILLDINAKSSSFGSKEVEGIPNEFERSASSSVLVSSGQTFALGGIYRIREKDNLAGVPFLKDIPVLGTFFRNQSTEGSDEELLFFITPRIVEGSFEDASSKVNS